MAVEIIHILDEEPSQPYSIVINGGRSDKEQDPDASPTDCSVPGLQERTPDSDFNLPSPSSTRSKIQRRSRRVVN